jgi:hypothetical protein
VQLTHARLITRQATAGLRMETDRLRMETDSDISDVHFSVFLPFPSLRGGCLDSVIISKRSVAPVETDAYPSLSKAICVANTDRVLAESPDRSCKDDKAGERELP